MSVLQKVLDALRWSQETAAERARMHRSTVKRCLISPEAMHPDMILRFAEAVKPYTDRILRWYCTQCCVVGCRNQYEFRDVSLSQAACELYGAVQQLEQRLNKLLAMAADNDVDTTEWPEFMSIFTEAQKTEQAILNLEVWAYSQNEKSSVRQHRR